MFRQAQQLTDCFFMNGIKAGSIFNFDKELNFPPSKGKVKSKIRVKEDIK